MLLMVCHLTRMDFAPDGSLRVCVAGLDLESGTFVRPVLSRPNSWTSADLHDRGGIFSLGTVLEVERAVNISLPPEVEDRQVSRGALRRLAEAHGGLLNAALSHVARHSVSALFGSELARKDGRASMPQGRGEASLGVLRTLTAVTLEVRSVAGKERPRLRCADAHGWLEMPVTDIRLYDPVTGAVLADRVRQLSAMLRDCRTLLAVGLTRPWAKQDGEPRHYLQVNNIFPEQDPLWQAGERT